MTTGSEVVFVFPPGPGNAGAFKNHLGAAYVRAALAREGMTTAQYLNASPGTIDQVATDIVEQKCPIVGFTVYDSNARLCLALSQSIKAWKPETKIVFGGPTATFSAQPLMEKNAVIDVCVIGEAEETAGRIFGKLLDGDLNEMQEGVAFRRDGEVVCTRLAPLVGCGRPGAQGTLDVTPSPYLSGILSNGREGVLTGRGCTHHCQYCCFAALGRMNLRLHSIERVVAELECIAEYQTRTGEHYPVTIFDDAFTLITPRAKLLCKALADRECKLQLHCITRADTVDEELIKLMKEAGFIRISFGLESAVPSVLRAIGKVRPPDWHDPDLAPERQFLERIRTGVFLARKYGLRVGVSIILGLPTETRADGEETLRFVEALPIDGYTHNFLWVFAGTPLWRTHKEHGIICSLDKIGLPETTRYAYKVEGIRPGPRSELREGAMLIQHLTADAVFGCDSPSRTGQGTSEVVLEADELKPHIAEWLRSTLNVGGTVVQVYPKMTSKEWQARIKTDRQVISEHLVPTGRYLQVRPWKKDKQSNAETWIVTCAGMDVYALRMPKSVTIRATNDAVPLVNWIRGKLARVEVCEISKSIPQPEELHRLMDQIESDKWASALQKMLPPPQVKYPGRWLCGGAPCASLRRIEISGREEIRCCRLAKSIGKVGDGLEALSRKREEAAAEVELRRGCATCGNTECPRCPYPGIDDQIYCQTIKTQKRARLLLHWIQSYSRLPLILAFQMVNQRENQEPRLLNNLKEVVYGQE
jgi:radical SAM superfamily enzyme YgiQ (UPF0313 family)